jgi:hypothetical protein
METSASIIINGVKQKIYMNNSVFLADNTEFEIEFYNKSSKTVCPAITINGEALTRYPVIYNGQKYILKDFISINKKFLFNTYMVDNSEDSLNAIKENGIIDIKYYYEKLIINYAKEDIATTWDDIPTENDGILYDISDYTPVVKHEIETGKIVKGSLSGVKYNNVDIELDLNFFEHQIIKLLPLSVKPLIQKCPKCSHNSSIEDNYCSNCSHPYS